MKPILADSFKGLSPQEIKDNIDSLCVSATESIIRRELSPKERAKMEQEFARLSINLAIKEDAFDKMKQDHKTDIAPIKLRISELIKDFRSNSTEIEGFVYEIPNQETGRMESYDAEGNLLQIRELLPEEIDRKLELKVDVG